MRQKITRPLISKGHLEALRTKIAENWLVARWEARVARVGAGKARLPAGLSKSTYCAYPDDQGSGSNIFYPENAGVG